jgi:hypothetical protein
MPLPLDGRLSVATPQSSGSADVNWDAAARAGLVAGLVYLAWQMALYPLVTGGSVWDVPRATAAILIGKGILAGPASFNLGVFIVGLLLHLTLAVGYALLLAAMIAGLSRGTAFMSGGVFGLVLYLINFYWFTTAFNWFTRARNWATGLGHIVFGLVAVGVYLALRQRSEARAVARLTVVRGDAPLIYTGPERRRAPSMPGAWTGPERRRVQVIH